MTRTRIRRSLVSSWRIGHEPILTSHSPWGGHSVAKPFRAVSWSGADNHDGMASLDHQALDGVLLGAVMDRPDQLEGGQKAYTRPSCRPRSTRRRLRLRIWSARRGRSSGRQGRRQRRRLGSCASRVARTGLAPSRPAGRRRHRLTPASRETKRAVTPAHKHAEGRRCCGAMIGYGLQRRHAEPVVKQLAMASRRTRFGGSATAGCGQWVLHGGRTEPTELRGRLTPPG